MREPKISFVSGLKAPIINDLCRLQHYTAILTNYKPMAVYCQMVSFMVVPKYTRHEGFVTKQRLREAKKLLMETNMLVSETYWKEGDQIDQYFIKMFKEAEGTTPLV